MKEDGKNGLSRREFFIAGGAVGATALGLAARPTIDYSLTSDPREIRHQFTQEQLRKVGESEKFETELGTFYIDIPFYTNSPEELKQRILDTKDNPSLIGVSCGEAAGLKTWVTTEDSFRIPLMPKGKGDMEDIVSLRVPFPLDINDDELTKFTNGTYKFSLNLRKWVRNKGSNLEVYEIIDKQEDRTYKYIRVSEGWVPLKP